MPKWVDFGADRFRKHMRGHSLTPLVKGCVNITAHTYRTKIYLAGAIAEENQVSVITHREELIPQEHDPMVTLYKELQT